MAVAARMATSRIRYIPDLGDVDSVTSESSLSITINEMLGAYWKPNAVFFHPPNGFWAAHVRNVTKMIKEGMKPGVADWILLWKGGCCAVELKVGTNKQLPRQKDFETWCNQVGVPYRLVRSVEGFEDVLKEFGLI